MPDPLIPFRTLSDDEQTRLRNAWATEMARQETTCALDEKIARFNAWLQPQGISFTTDDLPGKNRYSAASE